MANGFVDASLNNLIAVGILEHIIMKVIECVDMMRSELESVSQRIDNSELTIRDYLFNNYLNNDGVMNAIGFDNYRFHPEVPENYIDSKPIGRVDLHVYSIDDFRHRKRYFIIECKKINGTLPLNRAYIDEGIRRFAGDDPKYTSYYKTNGMIGFVVRNTDIESNVAYINRLMAEDYREIHVHEYLRLNPKSNMYVSTHGCDENRRVTLVHAFPNIATIIKDNY